MPSPDMPTTGYALCPIQPVDPLDAKFASTEAGVVIALFVATGIWFFRNIGLSRVSPTLSKWRYDLFKIPGLEKLVKWRFFSAAIRLIPALLFILVLATGFFGDPKISLGAGFTWLFWWTLLIFLVAFAGKIFCAVCPWDFFANLFQFGWIKKVKLTGQSLNLKWPRSLANIYVATGFFIVLTWLELGFEITRDSNVTAWLGLFVVFIVILSALVFERRSFCRYACPVGRISGLYSQFSPIELRTKDQSVCKTCVEKSCVRGTETSTACPTSQIPYRLRQNTYCTLCTECVRSCDKNNLTLKIRPVATDLLDLRTTRKDEATLAIVIFILTFFHGLTMTPTWFDWTGWMGKTAQTNYLQSFTVIMTGIIVVSFLFFAVFHRMLRAFLKLGKVSYGLILAFIPLILGYHLAHNGMHLFGEILNLVPAFNDPFGFKWDLFGAKDFVPYPLISHQPMKYMQLAAIVCGFWVSTKVLRVRIEQMKVVKKEAAILYLSHFAVMVGMGVLALWFVYQPMAMRSGY